MNAEMKTKVGKITALMLSAVILLCSCLPVFAESSENWDSVWQSADGEAGIIMFPGGDETSRNFSWYSDASDTPKVLVSENSDMKSAKTFTGKALKAPDGDFADKVTVSGLKAGTDYYYQCVSGDFESSVYTFSTVDESGEFSAMYVTDIHITEDSSDVDSLKNTSYKFARTFDDALSNNGDISLILSAGDQASLGLESEYKALTASESLKTVSFATTIGNHDRKGIAYKTFKNVPNESTNNIVSSYIGADYWFVKGNALFLVMDSNSGSGVDHRNFVKSAVEANPDVKWRVMMMHHDLYSGRIPHRESETRLMRTLWSPIADEFGIDLVLLGHSHYYTVTNVMYNNRTAEPFSATMTNPKGTVYMVSCSINRPRNDEDISLGKNVGYEYLTQEPVYNILDFTDDSITVSSYEVGADEPFNRYSIVKTTQAGGHKYASPNLFDSFASVVGTIYAFFNNIDVYANLKDKGYDVKFFETVFAH